MIFENNVKFSMAIEELAEKNHESVIDTLLEFMDEHMLEAEDVKKYLTDSLKEKLRQEFIERGMMQSAPTLSGFFDK